MIIYSVYITKLEKIEFLNKVQDNFLRLAREELRRFAVIDAGAELENVGREVEVRIKELMDS